MLKLLGFLSIKLQPLRKISILLSVILLAIIVTQLLGPSSYPKTNTIPVTIQSAGFQWELK